MADDIGSGLAPEERGRRVRIGLIAAGVVGVLLLLFVLQNTESQDVTFLFFEVRTPLWLALLVAAAMGVVLGEVAGYLLRRRRRRD